jgi:hypothetical protein
MPEEYTHIPPEEGLHGDVNKQLETLYRTTEPKTLLHLAADYLSLLQENRDKSVPELANLTWLAATAIERYAKSCAKLLRHNGLDVHEDEFDRQVVGGARRRISRNTTYELQGVVGKLLNNAMEGRIESGPVTYVATAVRNALMTYTRTSHKDWKNLSVETIDDPGFDHEIGKAAVQSQLLKLADSTTLHRLPPMEMMASYARTKIGEEAIGIMHRIAAEKDQAEGSNKNQEILRMYLEGAAKGAIGRALEIHQANVTRRLDKVMLGTVRELRRKHPDFAADHPELGDGLRR